MFSCSCDANRHIGEGWWTQACLTFLCIYHSFLQRLSAQKQPGGQEVAVHQVALPACLTAGCCDICCSERNKVQGEHLRLAAHIGDDSEMPIPTHMGLCSTWRQWSMGCGFFFVLVLLVCFADALGCDGGSGCGAGHSAPGGATSSWVGGAAGFSPVWVVLCWWIGRKREIVLQSFCGQPEWIKLCMAWNGSG